jgi:hypothetical protein
MPLSHASEPPLAPGTLSGELTLTEAALRVDLSGARSFTVVDHGGHAVGTFDGSLLRAIPLTERAALLVSEVARHPAPRGPVGHPTRRQMMREAERT